MFAILDHLAVSHHYPDGGFDIGVRAVQTLTAASRSAEEFAHHEIAACGPMALLATKQSNSSAAAPFDPQWRRHVGAKSFR